MVRFFDRDDFSDWPPGISDGLVSPCQVCGEHPSFDFQVSDELWQKVVLKDQQPSVVCLPCFDRIAAEKGFDANQHLREVQFTGLSSTVVLLPGLVVKTHLTSPPRRTAVKDSSHEQRFADLTITQEEIDRAKVIPMNCHECERGKQLDAQIERYLALADELEGNREMIKKDRYAIAKRLRQIAEGKG